MLCEGGVVPTSLPAGAPTKPYKCSQGHGNQWQQELRVTYKIQTEASSTASRSRYKPDVRIFLLVGAQRLRLRRAAEQRYFPVLLS